MSPQVALGQVSTGGCSRIWILTFAKGGDMDGILTSLGDVTGGVRMVVVVDATLPWTERGDPGDLATSWWLERVHVT